MKKIIIISTLLAPALHGATIVYNLRIAEGTKRQAQENKYRRSSIAALIVFNQWRQRYNGAQQTITGGLTTFIHTFRKSWFFRIDFAAAHVQEKHGLLNISRTQTDDLLFSAGHTHILSDRTHVTFSGLFGIPTHKDLSPQGVQFGTGHVGIGAQVDAAFIYSSSHKHSFLTAARLVHFFPRDICITLLEHSRPFKFYLGNVADLLIAHHSNYGRHQVEVGYNPGFAFGAKLCPPLDEFSDQANFIRNSFYGNYQYLFLIHKRFPSAVTFGFSYSSDQRPKIVGFKNIFTIWASWGINF